MEKEHFIKILQHYADSSVEEAQAVLLLKDNFPYSQLLHALSARLTKDHGFSNHQHELQMAAVYAADRSILKEVITRDEIFVSPSFSNDVSSSPSTRPESNLTSIVKSDTSSDLTEELTHDLERLQELRKNFESLFVDTDTTVKKTSEEKITVSHSDESITKDLSKSKKERIIELARAAQGLIEKELEQEASVEADPNKEGLKSKKERIIELAKAMQAKVESEVEPESDPENQAKSLKKKKENVGEELMDEIISSKHEIVPENEKQKEQLHIIEQFIKSRPSITQAKEKALPPPGDDLSTIKTGEFGDNVVSETLVEILIKQGKKDKAMEVLKKLIWKFPQKKAYFAAQIEDLRK